MGFVDVAVLGYGAYRLYELSKNVEENKMTKHIYWGLGGAAISAYLGPKLYECTKNKLGTLDRDGREEFLGSILLGGAGAAAGYFGGDKLLKSINKAYKKPEEN